MTRRATSYPVCYPSYGCMRCASTNIEIKSRGTMDAVTCRVCGWASQVPAVWRWSEQLQTQKVHHDKHTNEKRH